MDTPRRGSRCQEVSVSGHPSGSVSKGMKGQSVKRGSRRHFSYFAGEETEAQRGHAGRAWIQTPSSVLYALG